MLKRLISVALLSGMLVLAPPADANPVPAETGVGAFNSAHSLRLTSRRHKETRKAHRRHEAQRRAKARRIAEARRRAAEAKRQAALKAAATKKAQSAVDSRRGCGLPMYKGDGTKWQCTFFDNFDGTELDRAKWFVQRTASSGYYEGPECVVDSPDNIAVASGTLRLTSRKLDTPVRCPNGPAGMTAYSSATVMTYTKFAQTYGRFEFRAKFPQTIVRGVHSALWLWPQDLNYNPSAGHGEIDVAEFYSAFPDRLIPFLHYSASSSPQAITNNYCLVAEPGSRFHTYTMDWTPQAITISFDGVTCVRNAWQSSLGGRAPFNRPYFLALTQALGTGNNSFLEGKTPLPAELRVDYVRVWK